MVVDDRHLDVHDILDKATYGWVAPPTKPQIYVMDRSHSMDSLENLTRSGGVIIIHNNYSFERDKLCNSYETRVWSFPITIISQSDVLLQGLFDQCRETFDRYTNPTANTPFSTGTLGTGTTYNYAGIEKADQRHSDASHIMDCIVYLREQFVSVKIS